MSRARIPGLNDTDGDIAPIFVDYRGKVVKSMLSLAPELGELTFMEYEYFGVQYQEMLERYWSFKQDDFKWENN